MKKIEYYTITVTSILLFLVSFDIFWIFTQRMFEEVVFMSFASTFFLSCAAGHFIDQAFRKMEKGKRYV